MIHRNSVTRMAASLFIATVVFGGVAMQAANSADDKKPTSIAKQLVERDVAGAPGKEMVVVTVEYPPGVASAAHRHDADVLVYVLEGSVVMQVDGQPAVTLHPGETFYEGPNDIHRVSKNASATEPAKILVYALKNKGQALTRSVPELK